jgi:hypothetical protein
MKLSVLAILTLALAISAAAQKTPDFQAMEKGAWDAFGKGEGKYFQNLIADDAVLSSTKADFIKYVNSKPCEVKSYSFSNFKTTMIDANAALVTYNAVQDATCGGKAQPAKMEVSTIYVKRNGKWLAFHHQESEMMGP